MKEQTLASTVDILVRDAALLHSVDKALENENGVARD